MEGPLRDFNRKQKKINGREKNATEFPVLPQFHLYMFDRLKGITNSLIHIEVWLTCSHVCFQISHLSFSGKFCLLPQERHFRKRPLRFFHQGVSPKKYVKVTGLAVIMQFGQYGWDSYCLKSQMPPEQPLLQSLQSLFVDGGFLLPMSKGILSMICLIVKQSSTRRKVASTFPTASCRLGTIYYTFQ